MRKRGSEEKKTPEFSREKWIKELWRRTYTHGSQKIMLNIGNWLAFRWVAQHWMVRSILFWNIFYTFSFAFLFKFPLQRKLFPFGTIMKFKTMKSSYDVKIVTEYFRVFNLMSIFVTSVIRTHLFMMTKRSTFCGQTVRCGKCMRKIMHISSKFCINMATM